MFHGKDAAWSQMGALAGVVAVLVVLLGLAGCVTLDGPLLLPDLKGRSSTQLRQTQQPVPATPQSTQVETVADSRDIPLVPLPPVPSSSQAGRQNPVIRPTSAQMPAASAPAPQPPAQLPVNDVPNLSPPPAPPTVSATASGSTLTARQLYERAAARYAGIDSYITRLTRREQVKNKNGPEEVLLFKFRKKPWSVHFKWIGNVGKGREVLYVKDHYDNKLHTLLAAGDAPFMPAGKRLDLAIDSMMVRAASRHSITEAGFGATLERMGAALTAQERGQFAGAMNLLPPQNRPEYPQPVEAIEQVIPPGGEPEMPQGGRRLICFDPEWHLPLLIITRDHQGQEVEYYRYDLLQTPVKLDDDDFNPDKLWAAERPSLKR